jgi:hypothetical protein
VRTVLHITSHHITSHYITSHHIKSHQITSYHITSHNITSHHITSHHSTSHHITSHHITSHHITSHHITSHHITSHHITSHHITSHHITSYHILSHHIKSYQITSHYITCRMRLKHAEYSARGNQHRLPIAFHNVILRRILEEGSARVVTCNAPTPRPAAWPTSKTPGIQTCGPASRHGNQARAHGPERRTCSPIAILTTG